MSSRRYNFRLSWFIGVMLIGGLVTYFRLDGSMQRKSRRLVKKSPARCASIPHDLCSRIKDKSNCNSVGVTSGSSVYAGQKCSWIDVSNTCSSNCESNYRKGNQSFTRNDSKVVSVFASLEAAQSACETDALGTCVWEPEVTFFGDYPEGLMSEETIKDGGVILYIFGAMYMFLALSIVCDEFFVPALECMSDAWDISDEIAGATLMAAGGSAPELATSFIGTFTGSSVGFGTIVGSAVFNVLFVIGMCAFYSKDVLVLTWWPLARDSTYYICSLIILAIFFDVNSIGQDKNYDGEEDSEIEWYEASILLLMYIGYVLVMKFNDQLHNMVDSAIGGARKENPDGSGVPASATVPVTNEGKSAVSPDEMTKNPLQEKFDEEKGDVIVKKKKEEEKPNHSFLKPSTFRAGLLQYLVGDSTVTYAGMYAVSEIQGDLKETFDKVDRGDDGIADGSINRQELGLILQSLCEDMPKQDSEKEVEKCFKELDLNKDGKIDFEEFSVWYNRSEHLIRVQILRCVNEEHNGFITKENLSPILTSLGAHPVDEAVKHCVEGNKFDENGVMEHEEFIDWFVQSEYFSTKRSMNEKGDDGPPEFRLRFPDGTKERILFLVTLPLIVSMYWTLPDVRREEKKKYYFFTFFGAIVWIGIFSYLMVWWITIVGNTFGIPDEVMGLTFLAAGTSIPDLLSSVIVARKGHGDMAVSSSIGSNIFDVLVGLPLPWLAKSIYEGSKGNGASVIVVADTLFVSLLILIIMIFSVIMIIKISGWRMTHRLGVSMFVLYVVFVIQDLLQNACLSPTTAEALGKSECRE